MPRLSNLALGANRFDLSEAFRIRGARVGLGWNARAEAAPESERAALEDSFATADHRFEPASRGRRGDVLMVAFAGQGIGNLQWAAPCAAARAAGLALDALYLADPANAYYEQSPDGRWRGRQHFGEIIARHAEGYDRVLVVGSSMGGTAALAHAGCGHRVLAFGPRVDLSRTHGSYLPVAQREALRRAVRGGVAAHSGRRGSVQVHVGAGNLEDVLQADRVRGEAAVEVREHDTFQHNVPMHLEREGKLVPLVKRGSWSSFSRRTRPQRRRRGRADSRRARWFATQCVDVDEIFVPALFVLVGGGGGGGGPRRDFFSTETCPPHFGAFF